MQAPDVFHARPRVLTRREYERIAETGIFRGERVELVHGMVVRMSPIGPPHCDAVDFLNERLSAMLSGRARVRIQSPFITADESEPEPDIAIVPLQRYVDEHPSRAFLVIEVAETSLEYDRETKAPLYAASNVDEHWIVDLASRTVEVFRDAKDGRWTRTERVGIDGTLQVVAFPDVRVAVRDLFAR
jgi:Uma2 family endonuclease